MKILIDKLMEDLSGQIDYEPMHNQLYAEAKADSKQAKAELDEVVDELVSPSLFEWIPLVLLPFKGC